MHFLKHFYCPQMKLREGNVFTPVCDSVPRQKHPQADTLPETAIEAGGTHPT